MAQTLEELKAENAAKEAEALETTETQEAEPTLEVVETETEETQETAESNETETEEVETESWMQTEDQTSESDAKFTDSDIANVRRKFKAKLNKEKDENSELRAEIEALKNQIAQPRQDIPQQKTGMPKYSDYDYEHEYEADMKKWMQAIEDAYVKFWQKYGLVPPNTEISPSLHGKMMTVEESHAIAEVLDALDLQEEQEAETLRQHLYMAKVFAAWWFGVENKLLTEKDEED